MDKLDVRDFYSNFFSIFYCYRSIGKHPIVFSITQNMDTNKKIRIALSATIIVFNHIAVFCITWKFITKLFKYFLSSIHNWWRNNFINYCNRNVV
ncbi:MarC family protein [Candidatus Pelagibacter sp. Uisw_114]